MERNGGMLSEIHAKLTNITELKECFINDTIQNDLLQAFIERQYCFTSQQSSIESCCNRWTGQSQHSVYILSGG